MMIEHCAPVVPVTESDSPLEAAEFLALIVAL